MIDTKASKKTIDNWVDRYFDSKAVNRCATVKQFLEVHPECPVTVATFYRRIKKNKDGVAWVGSGRNPALTKTEEMTVLSRISDLQNLYNIVTTSMLITELIAVAVKRRPGEVCDTKAKKRIVSVTDEHYVRRFKDRHQLKTYYKSRPVELVRALKTQPELTLNYYRLLLHHHAIIQIHRALTEFVVSGWVLQGGQATREDGSGNQPIPGETLLEIRDGEIFVVPLDAPLEFVRPNKHFNGDEKPILPDSCDISSISTSNRAKSALVQFRRPSWTVTLW
jgi:hypothetical protein